MKNVHQIPERPWLLIPVETKAREFHAKVLFSCFAAERGWGVILGPRSVIRQQQVSFLPKGVLVEKSVSPVDENHLAASAANGNRMTGWDEEGLLYLSKEDYLERRISNVALGGLEKFFCWGPQQQADLASEPDIDAARLYRTGNPRFDLLREELRGAFPHERLKKKHGRTILINTKFGVVLPNDHYSEKYASWLDWLKASGRCKTEEQEKRLLKFVELQENTLAHYRTLIPALSEAFPGHRIIIRPHPSENNEFWEEETRKLRNVRVLYEGSVNEWILAADAMIHSNCTTGIEAYLLGKPSISFLPCRSEEVECHLANDLSIRTYDVAGTLETLRRLMAEGVGSFNLSGCEEAAAKMISGINGAYASERILDEIEALEGVEPVAFSFRAQPCGLRRKLDGWLHRRRQGIKHVKPNKRFPGMRLAEVAATISSLHAQCGRFGNVRARDMGQDTFCITGEDA